MSYSDTAANGAYGACGGGDAAASGDGAAGNEYREAVQVQGYKSYSALQLTEEEDGEDAGDWDGDDEADGYSAQATNNGSGSGGAYGYGGLKEERTPYVYGLPAAYNTDTDEVCVAVESTNEVKNERGSVSVSVNTAAAPPAPPKQNGISYADVSEPSTSSCGKEAALIASPPAPVAAGEPRVDLLSHRIALPKSLGPSAEKHRWNETFQKQVVDVFSKRETEGDRMPVEEQAKLLNRFIDMGCLYQDFARVAKLYAELIVNEMFLPDKEKTIMPVTVGGIAGGDKVCGLSFIRADSHSMLS